MENQSSEDKKESFFEQLGIIVFTAFIIYLAGVALAAGAHLYNTKFADAPRMYDCPPGLKLVYDSSDGGAVKCVNE